MPDYEPPKRDLLALKCLRKAEVVSVIFFGRIGDNGSCGRGHKMNRMFRFFFNDFGVFSFFISHEARGTSQGEGRRRGFVSGHNPSVARKGKKKEKKEEKKNSQSGTRTRAARVRVWYPNHLDQLGFHFSFFSCIPSKKKDLIFP